MNREELEALSDEELLGETLERLRDETIWERVDAYKDGLDYLPAEELFSEKDFEYRYQELAEIEKARLRDLDDTELFGEDRLEEMREEEIERRLEQEEEATP